MEQLEVYNTNNSPMEEEQIITMTEEVDADIIIDDNVNLDDILNFSSMEIEYEEQLLEENVRNKEVSKETVIQVNNNDNRNEILQDITLENESEVREIDVPVTNNSSKDNLEEKTDKVEEANVMRNFEQKEDFNTDNSKIRKVRNRKADPSTWEKNKTKLMRMKGKKYIGYEVKRDGIKKSVIRTTSEREERKLGPPCTSKICKTGKKRQCLDFSDDDRKKIFNEFWKLSWVEKEMFVACNTSITKPKKRTGKTPSRCNGTVTYTLQNQGSRKIVCKKMFLSTLGLNEWMVLNWVKKANIYSKNHIDDPDDVSNSDTVSSSSILQTSTIDNEKNLSKGKISEKKDSFKKLVGWITETTITLCKKRLEKTLSRAYVDVQIFHV